MTGQSVWTTVDGLRVHSRVWAGSRPPVVCVHGFVVSGRYLEPTAEVLARRGRAVEVPDLPGSGRSDDPRDVLDVPGLADALAAWMDARGIERAPLLANSLGCQVVVDLAVRRPERAAALVLVGPTGEPDRRSLLRLGVPFLAETPGHLGMAHVFLADLARFGPRRFVGTLRALLADRPEEKLPRVTAPAVVVRGGADRIVTAAWAAEVARLLPQGRLVTFDGVHHAVNWHAPERLVDAAAGLFATAGVPV